jgi:hypothetical protein
MKEDQMVAKIKTIEVQLSSNAAARGDSVVLTANLSDRELEEVKAQGGYIEFLVDDYPLENDPNDPRSAI